MNSAIESWKSVTYVRRLRAYRSGSCCNLSEYMNFRLGITARPALRICPGKVASTMRQITLFGGQSTFESHFSPREITLSRRRITQMITAFSQAGGPLCLAPARLLLRPVGPLCLLVATSPAASSCGVTSALELLAPNGHPHSSLGSVRVRRFATSPLFIVVAGVGLAW